MDKRELIIKCAIEIMSAKGHHNARIQEIADKAGVAVGTIYHYFRNKEELIEYIFEVECDKQCRFIAELNNRKMEVMQKIELFIQFNIEVMENNPDILKLIVQECSLISSLNHKVQENAFRVINSFAELIKIAQEQGKVKNLDAGSFAKIILNTLHSAVDNYLLKDTKGEYQNKKMHIKEYILDGIKS
jgi:TetR/AcrR family transcriptional regulator, fatty acid metabolism regulator protein